MTLKYTLVPTYIQMLGALSAWLGKADEGKLGDKMQTLNAGYDAV